MRYNIQQALTIFLMNTRTERRWLIALCLILLCITSLALQQGWLTLPLGHGHGMLQGQHFPPFANGPWGGGDGAAPL